MNETGWPLWSSEHPEAGPPVLTCPNCGQKVAANAAFCEACGATLLPTQPPPKSASPTHGSAQTRRLGVRNSELVDCPVCGGTIDADGYCQTCGAKAPSARDHYSQAPAAWVGGVCDRGVQHARNEDAMALWARGARAVLVVCDGVSTSVDSDAAATSAATIIRDQLVTYLRQLGPEDDHADLTTAIIAAAEAANAEVAAMPAADTANAPSATLAAAVVMDSQIYYANLGDSRVYFISERDQLQLSLDDSMAQAFIAQGMDRAEAEALPRAHAITKWLGRDATSVVPRVGVHQVSEPGWVAVCSDGLWNYASSPSEFAAQLRAASAEDTEPAAVAQRLVQWANSQGGRDNITVALAKCPAPPDSNLDPDKPASLPQA